MLQQLIIKSEKGNAQMRSEYMLDISELKTQRGRRQTYRTHSAANWDMGSVACWWRNELACLAHSTMSNYLNMYGTGRWIKDAHSWPETVLISLRTLSRTWSPSGVHLHTFWIFLYDNSMEFLDKCARAGQAPAGISGGTMELSSVTYPIQSRHVKTVGPGKVLLGSNNSQSSCPTLLLDWHFATDDSVHNFLKFTILERLEEDGATSESQISKT